MIDSCSALMGKPYSFKDPIQQRPVRNIAVVMNETLTSAHALSHTSYDRLVRDIKEERARL